GVEIVMKRRILVMLAVWVTLELPCSLAADGVEDARASFIGMWRRDNTSLFYSIAPGDNGDIVVECAYDGQERLAGHGKGRVEGDYLRGTWYVGDGRGAVVAELSRPGVVLVTWWKGDSREAPFAGRYHLHKLSNKPDGLLALAREAQAWRYEIVEKYAQQAA